MPNLTGKPQVSWVTVAPAAVPAAPVIKAPENPEPTMPEESISEPKVYSSAIQFCLDKKDAILAMHSSTTETQIFVVECIFCQRFYKHCMFSKKERKNDDPMCRWCQLGDGEDFDSNQFEIEMHIHCNRGGKKECSGMARPYSLELPASRRQIPELRMGEILPEPEVTFTVKKKMSQKERKAALKAANALL